MTSRPQPQDTITFNLRADKTVVSDTVKISVYVNALVTNGQTEDSLRGDIKTALSAFIKTANWQFSNVTRSLDGSGFERLSLIASARVSEQENYSLEQRAKNVARQGLQLQNVSADTTIPAAILEEAEVELRRTILTKATEEAKALAEALGRAWRVGHVGFGDEQAAHQRKSVGATMAASYGSGFSVEAVSAPGGGGESLTNAQKLSLSAAITLLAPAPEY